MEIVLIAHKGLRDYYTANKSKGLKQDLIPRIRTILFALAAAPDMETLEGPPGWRIHPLKGDREGHWSISVSGNWRITFKIVDGVIADLDLEDYH